MSENGNAKEKFGDWRETNATLDNNKVSVNYWSQFCSSTTTFLEGDESPKIMGLNFQNYTNGIEELSSIMIIVDLCPVLICQPQYLVIKFKVPSSSKEDC